MPPRKTTVLAVDDDIYLLRMLKRILELESYEVATAADGEKAMDTVVEKNPDLVLLDVMMPGIDGYTVCQKIREFSSVPIIMITAKNSPQEISKGLDSGADDYVTKPFSSAELVARVKAVLRRSRLWELKKAPSFHTGELTVDFASHRVTVAGKDIDLTATEYRIISYLAQNAGMVLTPDNILGKVWGDDYSGESHMLQVNIARIRSKLGNDTGDTKYIVTKPGIGYMIERQE